MIVFYITYLNLWRLFAIVISYLLMPPTATPTAEVMLMVVVHRLDRRLEMLSLESDVYQNR
jgi:hypothetical protein